MFTFVLAYIVLSVATVTPPQQRTTQNFQFALCIGSCVTVGGFAIGAMSGGSLNPAVSWGLSTAAAFGPSYEPDPAVTGGTSAQPPQATFVNCLWYSFAELLGGAVAACVFFTT